MSYLLDTNVISEVVRSKPNRNVTHWLESVAEEHCYLSVLTLGELHKGVESLPKGKRKDRIRGWLENDVTSRFEGRILGIDVRTAETWGRLLAGHGRPAAAVDSLLAATALVHDCAIVTRNVKNFGFAGLRVVDPFATGPLE